MSKYIIPTMNEIKVEYYEIIAILKRAKTYEDVLALQRQFKREFYINEKPSRFYNGEAIEVIRCNNWRDLERIYYFTDGSKPRFAVWNDYFEVPLIEHEITMDGLKTAYEMGVLNALMCCVENEEIENIKEALEEQGYSKKELKYIFGFDAEHEFELEYSEIRKGSYKVFAETEEKAMELLIEAVKKKKVKEPESVDYFVLPCAKDQSEYDRCEDCECDGDCESCKDCDCCEEVKWQDCCEDCNKCDDDDWCEDCEYYEDCHKDEEVDEDNDISTPEEFMEFFMDFADYCSKNIKK